MSSPIRVLLVEDNPGDAELIRDTLESSKLMLEIEVVTDGAQAVDYLLKQGVFARAETPDLIMLDLNLPKMDGRQVLERVKTSERLKLVPVVILTSSDAENDVVRSYQLGANCYVIKPVDLAAFQSIVKAIEGFWFTVVKRP